MRRVIFFITCILLTLFSTIFSFCQAKDIPLYEKSESTAKPIGTINSSTGMTLIYSLPKGDWVKVGDPHNGNIGWIKSTDLTDKNGNTTTELIVKQETISSGSGPQSIQVVRFGKPAVIPTEQEHNLIKCLQSHQQQLEASMAQLMQSFTNTRFSDSLTPFPIVMPGVILSPLKELPAFKTPARSNE